MLPRHRRLHRAPDFTAVTRRGDRTGRGSVVVYLSTHEVDATGAPAAHPARAGLIVGKTVGNSVVRHQVSRRLRAQLAPRLVGLADGSDVVVRALPAAATASSTVLGADLDAALTSLARRRKRSR